MTTKTLYVDVIDSQSVVHNPAISTFALTYKPLSLSDIQSVVFRPIDVPMDLSITEFVNDPSEAVGSMYAVVDLIQGTFQIYVASFLQSFTQVNLTATYYKTDKDAVSAPSDLLYYKPDKDTYSLSWRINPLYYENIDNFDCEIQTDTSSTFDSINLKSYTKNTVYNYQDDPFFKAFIFKDPNLLLQDITYYWRVRVNSSSYISDWSESGTFQLYKSYWYSDTNLFTQLIPDKNVYSQEGIVKSFKLVEAHIREHAKFKKEIDQITSNINYYKTQDADLYDYLGSLLEYPKESADSYLSYKRELLELWNAFLTSGTEAGIKRFIKAIMGIDPIVVKLKDRYGWIVHSEQDLPPTGADPLYSSSTMHYFLRDDTYPELSDNTPWLNSSHNKGSGIYIQVMNPFNVPTRRTLIESVVNKLKPINVNVYFRYLTIAVDPVWGTGYWGDSSYWGVSNWTEYTPAD